MPTPPPPADLPSSCDTPPGTALKRDLVAGLEKGLAVIEAFDQQRPRLTISEVAERTGLTRAAARRYLITLGHLGFVSQDRGLYALTAKVLRLAQSYMHSGRLPRIVQPELHQLVQAQREASSAGVLDGNDVLCVAALTAGRLVSPTLQPGTRVPAHCTANGRVLLAALPDEALADWLARQSLQALTPFTVTDPAALRAEIERVRAAGHAAVDQEFETGLRTLSVPLRNHRDDVVAAINISVHASRVGMAQLVHDHLPALLQAQTRLKAVL